MDDFEYITIGFQIRFPRTIIPVTVQLRSSSTYRQIAKEEKLYFLPYQDRDKNRGADFWNVIMRRGEIYHG
jgi:hypothetical protein